MKTMAASLVLAASAFAQPTSLTPLAPPMNGVRRADPAWYALVDCTVHPKAGTPALERATVVVRDGVIIAVLPGETDDSAPAKPDGSKALKPARTPLGPKIIQSNGLHVYPGWIDAYVEVDAPSPRGDDSTLHWNTRVTPQRSALDGAGLDEAAAASMRKLGFTAAAISPKGGIFRGRGSVVSLAKPAEDVSSAKTPVYAENVYQCVAMETGRGGGGGGGAGVGSWGSYPDSQMGAIAVIRQTFEDAKWQHKQKSQYKSVAANALSYLTSSEEGGQRFVFDASNELDIYRIGAIISEQGGDEYPMRPMILGSGLEFRRLAGLKEIPSLKLLLPLTFAKAPDVSTPGKQEGVDLREMMMWEQGPTNPRRLHNAGIEFALTTAKLRDKSEFAKNLKTAVTYGLPEEVALEALTLRPAAWLGLSDRLGSIEAGQTANIIITDGPIFGNTAATLDDGGERVKGKPSKVRGVWVDGVWHEINAVPVVAQGTWDVVIPLEDKPIARSLTIDRDNGITVVREGKEVKATRVSVEEGKLTFTFDHDALTGEGGVCSMAAVLQTMPAPGDDVTKQFTSKLTGVGVTNTGKRFEWIATKRPRQLTGIWPVQFDNPNTPSAVLVVDSAGSLFAATGVQYGEPLVTKDITFDGKTLTYKVDHQPQAPGQSIITVQSTVDWEATMPTLAGVATTPSGEKWAWKALRRSVNPFVGDWKVTIDEPGDHPQGNVTLTIKKDSVTVTFAELMANADDAKPKKKDKVTAIKADDVKFSLGLPEKHSKATKDTSKDAEKDRQETPAKEEGDKDAEKSAAALPILLTFTHDLKPLGGEGKSSDSVTILFGNDGPKSDALIGEGTLPDGTKHKYKATRIADGKDEEKAEDQDEAPKDIPEELPLPMGAYGFTQYPQPADHTIISNVTLWTCAGDDSKNETGVIEKGYVYIKGGKIAQVGEGEPNIAVPQGERSSYINGQGKHLTPGIIDCHSHTGISGGVNESGQAVTAEVRVADVTNPDAIGWYQQLAGGVTIVNNLHGSANAIGGQSQTNKLRWGCASPLDMHFEGAAPGIKFALGENPRRANGDGPSARYPNTRMGVEMLIRDRFTAAREYAADTSNRRRDLELEALAEVLAGTRLVHCHSYRQDEMLMLALVAKEFKFKIGTYQHALEGYKVADYVRDFSGGASGFADWWAYKVEVQDAIPAAFSIMHEQGAVASFNSDSNELARRLNTEAAKAVKYGDTPPHQALKFVTLYPAKQLKIDNRVGSIEVGKDADLALWSGSPLSSFSRCEMTFVDGRKLFSLDDDAAHREKAQSERLRLIQKLLEDKKKDADKPVPSGDSPRPRRGRPPQTDAERAEDAQLAEVQRAFYQLYTEGKFRHAQGICGCGITHNYSE